MLGEVRVVARADLGGLGTGEGPPAVYVWTPASLIPQMLPWIGVVLLLLLPPNRCAAGWWILAPMAVLAVLEMAARSLDGLIPSEPLDVFCVIYGSLGFGLAGAWLTAPYFGRGSRWLAFLGMLVVVLGVSGLAAVARGGGELGLEETLMVLIFVGVGALTVAGSLNLGAVLCRRRAGAGQFLGWVAIFLTALWLVVALPFLVVAWVVGGSPHWYEVLPVVMSFAGVTFVVILPFLLTGFLVPFYRERLWRFFRLAADGAGAPPVIPRDGARGAEL